ncbi:DUF1028 domain-containing protein [Ponticoccus sp. SC2-23]|uniref:DUF1028 domain-containing protein n=1 Tax=Alexandriicola marinus TaxID=2081710 RepID=UPI000FD9DA85|nr:DUF1028 domain-containing protein [Alexandriicola marinus]MBM1219518.1 DUF1028 domain-containing protein [Ponticoccus sp. SC6-9]MBM1223410.1 DUF1028 domain-containing protein [Ponticoccus sp. SC6-15]MBM1229331.1 DUF1028 domain-containing protein [Ponticoccus sp. SC6-38]MBM1232376.1 DUF1028 domain-containing protein [Ponticoccus sp. SC6-45]MBM1237674.1 DUF1028 domain-containing protein [Ponticoccus sp. SC6-49]MBM1241387.1 DUF1028 domain-containing protein [Ponticoccus sp. SC2-64]MBM1245900
MTFSILTFDRKTGVFAGAAATGSLCVGGWVLRGDIESGMVASQGTAPSTFWRDEGLRRLHSGQSSEAVVRSLTGADGGRDHRQMAALDRSGGTAAFTGARSIPYADAILEDNLVVAGNMLAGPEVLSAMRDAAQGEYPTAAARLFSVFAAAQAAGGDSRGLQSAAMLILSPDSPPLDVRIDHSDDPIAALHSLYEKTQSQPYYGWLDEVPVLRDKTRAP